MRWDVPAAEATALGITRASMNLDLTWLVGQPFRALAQDTEWAWLLEVGPASVRVACPWRVVSPEGIAATSADHGQRFGLAQPVNAGVRAAGILGGRRIVSVEVDEDRK